MAAAGDGGNAAAAAVSHAKVSNQAHGDMDGSSSSSGAMGQYELPGLLSSGLMLQLGGSSSSSSSRQDTVRGTASGAGLQLHVGSLALLDELVAGARYSQAAYGYVAAAGHLHSISNAIKLLATLPLFDPITGETSWA